MAATETMTYQDSLNSQYLSSSLSSLSRSRSTNSFIVRTYKQATQLYLTKRFKEALETLEPIISAQQNDDERTNGDANGHEDATSGSAPVAQSTRGTRTKVWVFYLSLLHAIIDMGQEEGRNIFGSTKWRELASKAREWSVWEEVVQRGYDGNEGDVDADVVVNLATLLLGHMQDQRLNQQRLETYLASSDSNGAGGQLAYGQDGMSTPMSNSSSSPKLLQTRLKILELYTLHVLPANEEWEYARSFIGMSDMLDEERKDAFMHALQNLQEEKDGTAQRERELKEQREREMEQQKREEDEARRAEEARQDDERRKAAEVEKQQRAGASRAPNGNTSAPTRPTHKPTPSQSSRPSKPQKKPPPSPPPTFYRRASSMLANLQLMARQASRNMNISSMLTLRFVMFLVAFLLIVARRDLRIKLRRAIDDGWTKVKSTVGMGVKVSYI